MYSNEQIKQMCIDFLVDRENVTHSEAEMFRDQPFARWTGMDSLGATEIAMWIEKTFGVKVSDEEMLGMSLSLLIPKIASMQKLQSPVRATDTSVVQKSDKGGDGSVSAKPQRKTSSSTKKTKKGAGGSMPVQSQKDSVADVQPVDNTKADCLAVCKLLGDVCNAQVKGQPNYQARNYCEFVNCLLYENFQKLR